MLWVFLDLLLFASFAFLLSLLNAFHFLVLLAHGRSTIEFCAPLESAPRFDRGLCNNVTSVLGKNPFLWALPLRVTVDSSNA